MDFFFYNTDAKSLLADPRPRFPILIREGFAATGGNFEKYGGLLGQFTPGDLLLMYENGVGVVAIGRVAEPWDHVSHDEPRYYFPDELGRLSGIKAEYRIAVNWFLDLADDPVSVAALHQRVGYQPPAAVQRVGKAKEAVAQLVAELLAERGLLPGEIDSPKQYTEGAATQRWVNAYERNPAARDECKKLHGTACVICGFDFGNAFGSEFTGFIHVHHLKPLSEVKKEYQVNPETDLIPVCPNCHAVLHHGGQMREPDEVKKLLKKAANSESS